MTIYTNLNPPPPKPDRTGGKNFTETAGYVSTKRRIEEMIQAGERLVQARQEQFDFMDEVDMDEQDPDPTRQPGFDLADASMIAQDLRFRLKAQQKNRQAVTPTPTPSESASVQPEASPEEKNVVPPP